MSTQFSLYAARESGLHHLHPLTKLAITCFLLGLLIVLPGRWSPMAIFLLAILPLALWGRVLGEFLRAAVRVIIPFTISLLIIYGLIWRHGGPVLFSIGPISYKWHGVLFALAAAGRILAMVSSFLLLAISTRPDRLMLALTQKGLPDVIGYVVLTTIQIVPRFQAKATTILDAQRSRGMETTGLVQRFRAVLPLIGPLVLGSIVDIEERAIALEARGFSRKGPKTSLFEITDRRGEQIMRWALMGVLLGLMVVRLMP